MRSTSLRMSVPGATACRSTSSTFGLTGSSETASCPGERMTRSNISKYDAPDAEKYMRVSGLLGPVRVKFFERVKITPQDKIERT